MAIDVNIDARRRRVGAAAVEGQSVAEIAAAEGVSVPTVKRDLAAIRLQRPAPEVVFEPAPPLEYPMSPSAARSELLERLREMDDAAQRGFEKEGHARWLEVRLRVADRVSKLLGLDIPPERRIPGVADGPAVSVLRVGFVRTHGDVDDAGGVAD